MRLPLILLLSTTVAAISGCETAKEDHAPSTAQKSETAKSDEKALTRPQEAAKSESASIQKVSLIQADSANLATQATERKIIRNANLTVEVTSPTEAQRKISSIAESHQGFVVTSEATQRTSDDTSKPAIVVNLVVRVPAAQFNQAMEEI